MVFIITFSVFSQSVADYDKMISVINDNRDILDKTTLKNISQPTFLKNMQNSTAAAEFQMAYVLAQLVVQGTKSKDFKAALSTAKSKFADDYKKTLTPEKMGTACTTCKGGAQTESCPKCRGQKDCKAPGCQRGIKPVRTHRGQILKRKCPTCMGTNKCPTCKGTGQKTIACKVKCVKGFVITNESRTKLYSSLMGKAVNMLRIEKADKVFVEKYSTAEIRKGKKVSDMNEREFTLALIKTKRKIIPEMEAKGLVYFQGEFVKQVVKEHTEGLAKEIEESRHTMMVELTIKRLENMINVYSEALNKDEAKRLLKRLRKGGKGDKEDTTASKSTTGLNEHEIKEIAKSTERFIDDWMIKQLEEADTSSFWQDPKKKVNLKAFKSWDVLKEQGFKWNKRANRVPLEVESNSGKSTIYISLVKVDKSWKIAKISK